MISINFDNPYLLLIAIPLLLLIVVPFAIAIRRDNRTKSVITSLILHVFMVVCIIFALAGTEVTATVTETQVYVVADVSYSSKANLDIVDEYIEKVEKQLPRNSKMGVICFAKDYQVLTPLGKDFKTVKNHSLDDSGTNIAQALDYTGTLFGTGVVKRIVLITDGKETNNNSENLITAIQNLYMQNVYIDVMYIDNNASASMREVQASEVDYVKTTYKNHATTANVLIESSYSTQAYVTLSDSEKEIERKAVSLDVGFNIINFDLDTSEAGIFDYFIEVEAQPDASSYNNKIAFTQKIVEKIEVLALTNKTADRTAIEQMYGDNANVTVLRITEGKKVAPCTVEELVKYDEIILSNIDVRTIENYMAFIDSVDKVVSHYGKSLITIGDVEIQNATDDVLMQLDDMLPVKFGKNDNDPKFLGIVVDISRSMNQASRLEMAKSAAKQLIELLGEKDEFALVAFSGQAYVEIKATEIEDEEHKASLFGQIDSLQPSQGTYVGDALQAMYNIVKTKNTQYSEKQVMLLSDGLNYTGETKYNPQTIAANLFGEFNTPVSSINTGCADNLGVTLLKNVVTNGRGKYYYVKTIADLNKLMLTEVADDMTDAIVETESAVHVEKTKDEILSGIGDLSENGFASVNGYVNSRKKTSATTVLTVDYLRPSGSLVQSPLYAYWNYGNGRVCSFTSTLSGEWVENFKDQKGTAFLENILTVNIPQERIEHPYTLTTSYDGTNIEVEMVPAAVDTNATMQVSIIDPDGNSVSQTLLFDTNKYFGEFAFHKAGKYTVNVDYTYGTVTASTTTYFNISYSLEYDAFVAYDSAVLYSAVRNMGTVTEDGSISLKVDENKVETYTSYLTIPLMVITVVLFVIDIAVRKLKWEDILGLFGKKVKKKEGK